MTQRTWRRFRWMRRVAIVMAAAPLFQVSQCGHGLTQVVATSLNQAPASFFQMISGLATFPIRSLLSGGFNFGLGFGGT